MVSVVSIVREGGFYYLKHRIHGREKRGCLGKAVPEDIERLKREFLRKFYCEVWDGTIRAIGQKYRAEVEKTPRAARLKNFEGFGIAFTYNTQRIRAPPSQKWTRMICLRSGSPRQKNRIPT